MAEEFGWVPAYEAIATKLLEYEDRQDELAAIVEKVLNEHYTKMDPLTFFSMFNGKRINYDVRSKAVKIVLDQLSIALEVPTKFDGVPTTNPQRWRYWNGQPGNIEKNWAVFRAALALADAPSPSDDLKQTFIECFNTAVGQTNVGEGSLTMALYWARPMVFLPLDGYTSPYLRNRFNLTAHPVDGGKYLTLIESVRQKTEEDFVHISFAAWEKAGWIPAPSEYDPGITAKEWVDLLNDHEIGKVPALTALKCLNEHPKGATCTELSEFYGRTSDFYSNNLSVLGENVCKRKGVPPREVENGKYWPVVCLGNYVGRRRHGTFEWKLRDEVREALKSIDLSGIVLKASDEVNVPGFDAGRFGQLISLYKKDFHQFRGPNGPEGDRETYKWKNLVTFRKNWNIDAENLQDMIQRSLKPSATGEGTLLDNRHERPYDTLLKFAEYDAAAVREAFRKLFDDNASVQMAYAAFSRDMTDLLGKYNEDAEEPLKTDDQSPKAASIYLFFEKPSRYYMYKATVADSFASAIGATLPTDPINRFYQYEALCDALMPIVVGDEELLAMADSVLTQEQRDADSAHHLLLQDIAYYAARYLKDMNENWEAVLNGEEDVVPPKTNPTNTAPAYPKNLILYGPPGTGKTYQTRAYAVAICDGRDVHDVLQQMKTAEGNAEIRKRYQELVDDKRVGFTTFHQSYGYEEFIEGIRPRVIAEDEAEDPSTGGVSYSIEDGIFKDFCLRADKPIVQEEAVDFGFNDASTVWKVSLEGTGDNPTRTECLKNGHIRIGWDEYGPTISDETDWSKYGGKTVLNAFITKMRKGDIVLSCYSSTTIDAIGVITGDVEWHDEYDEYKRLRAVNWIAKGLNFDIVSEFGIPTLTLSTVYKLKLDASQVVQVLDKAGKTKRRVTSRETLPHVFVIDEVNRGNVSKVFGELITLLEEDKRKGEPQELAVTLPYSGKPFSVPSNVYVIGTMNTADRSIALMDTALRRRFSFTEVMPDPNVLDGVEVEGIDIPRMLDVMNRRIELLYDREHALGHAYFIPLKDNPSNRTIACLSGIFHDRLMPLLQEYFFDDYAKIASVLGAAAQDFLEPLKSADVFWKGDRDAPDHLQGYRVKETPTTADAYMRIYQDEREA